MVTSQRWVASSVLAPAEGPADQKKKKNKKIKNKKGADY